MLVDYINGIHMNANNNIFTIPETGVVTVTAHNITPANFDAPVLVHFEYSYKILLVTLIGLIGLHLIHNNYGSWFLMELHLKLFPMLMKVITDLEQLLKMY